MRIGVRLAVLNVYGKVFGVCVSGAVCIVVLFGSCILSFVGG